MEVKQGLVVDVPGQGTMTLRRLLLDYNGTLALDGSLLPGVIFRLERLVSMMEVVVLTADTHHSAADNLAWTGLTSLGVRLVLIPSGQETATKAAELARDGADTTCAVGNGRNDERMLAEAGLSIAVVGAEGAAREAVRSAAIVTRDIEEALDLLLFPKRLIATLRN